MRILSAIISSIWNTVTFMDKEQRALVAHVLTVSQAHPKSFAFRNQTGRWESKGLKITFDKAHNEVFLSEVKYKLGWRANTILARHFAMLHICLHHEHIGKALSDIDKSENEPKEPDTRSSIDKTKPSKDRLVTGGIGRNAELSIITPAKDLPFNIVEVKESSVNLSNFVGKEVIITHLDGFQSRGEVYLHSRSRYEIAGHTYFVDGKIWETGRPASAKDITKIELVAPVKNVSPEPRWSTDIDLTKWIGKAVDVKLRNGVVIDAVDITAEPRAVVYIVRLGEILYTKHGNYWHSQLDGRDVVAIRLST